MKKQQTTKTNLRTEETSLYVKRQERARGKIKEKNQEQA